MTDGRSSSAVRRRSWDGVIFDGEPDPLRSPSARPMGLELRLPSAESSTSTERLNERLDEATEPHSRLELSSRGYDDQGQRALQCDNEDMTFRMQSWVRALVSRWVFPGKGAGPSKVVMYTPGARIPIRQTKLAPDGVEFSEDVSEARWVEESLSNFGTLRSLLPDAFPAYARISHPAYLDGDEARPVRWTTVASWTGRTVHPLMQFDRIAGLGEDSGVMYEDPPWGSHPQVGSIPEAECRTLVQTLGGFTATPDNCYFCLWEGYGDVDKGLYKANARVRAPGRDYLLFRGPVDSIMAFITGDWPFPRHSPNIWWPEDRAWCVATDIDLYDTYVGGSRECIETVLSDPGLEALPTALDARVSQGRDIINAGEVPRGCGERPDSGGR